MPKSPPYARIAITLPPEDLATADRLARDQDRSRSWIIAESVRRYAAELEGSGAAGPPRVRPGDEGAHAVSRGLGPSRTSQLLRDLALTPEERVLLADETLAMNEPVVERASRASRSFATYEEFLDWKRDRVVR